MATLIKEKIQAIEQPRPLAPEYAPVMTRDNIPYDLLDYFGLTSFELDGEMKTKLKAVWDYFSPAKADALKNMSEAERKIGSGGYERPLDKLYRYSVLSKQIDNLNQQRENLYGRLN